MLFAPLKTQLKILYLVVINVVIIFASVEGETVIRIDVYVYSYVDVYTVCEYIYIHTYICVYV